MTARLPRRLTLVLLTAAAGASGQTIDNGRAPPPLAEEEEISLLEVLPPDAQADVTEARNLLQINGALAVGRNRNKNFSVISELFLQVPTRPVTVCFIGLANDFRRRIAEAARGWEFPTSSLRFDFGIDFKLRSCDKNVPSDIRISSNGRGTWSLIGREADLTRSSDNPTMNFGSSAAWDTMLKPQFRRIVQHEFGHAIGLYHEHQNPNGACLQELRWDRIKSTFTDLSEDYLRANFIALISPAAQPFATKFDEASIMMYDLPAAILKGGESSPCFRAVNMIISKDDRAMIERKYSRDPKKSLGQRFVAYKFLNKALRDPAVPEDSRKDLQLAIGALYPFADAAARDSYLQPARSIIEQR
ncbi:M12 family metallopeptidase [Sphingomonas aerolata]|uniref:M12 family metallopeptidase n=1 Tax=Sphingomonas aerolata TaxID=185951 RepID=UPI00141B778B|nr:hypothetical protein [Sphingomonas aerolata]